MLRPQAEVDGEDLRRRLDRRDQHPHERQQDEDRAGDQDAVHDEQRQCATRERAGRRGGRPRQRRAEAGAAISSAPVARARTSGGPRTASDEGEEDQRQRRRVAQVEILEALEIDRVEQHLRRAHRSAARHHRDGVEHLERGDRRRDDDEHRRRPEQRPGDRQEAVDGAGGSRRSRRPRRDRAGSPTGRPGTAPC